MLQPFKYAGGYRDPATIDYGEPQQEKEQGGGNLGGLNDLMTQFGEGGGMNMFSSAGGGEAALAQGGSGSMGPIAELAAAESGAGIAGAGEGGGWMASMFGGGGGAAGGSAGSSGMTAAMSNPWTALAAVVIGNEIYAHKKGYRDKDPVKYAGDLVTGEVLNQDLEQRWLPKLGIKDGSTASDSISMMSNPLSSLTHPKRSMKRLKGFWDKIF